MARTQANFRLSSDEDAAIKRAAKRAGKKPGEFMRDAALKAAKVCLCCGRKLRYPSDDKAKS